MNYDPDDKIALLAERDALRAKLDASEQAVQSEKRLRLLLADEKWSWRLRAEQAEAKLDASKRAVAQAREILRDLANEAMDYMRLRFPDDAYHKMLMRRVEDALSSDAGRDYVPRVEVDAIRAVAQKVVDEWGRRTMETPMAFAEAISGLTQILAAHDARKEGAG